MLTAVNEYNGAADDRAPTEDRQMPQVMTAKPQSTVFYSWQSDLPNATNRGLIQEALERAVKAIRQDDSLAVDPVLDRDTQNVPGSPDIAHTIFQKIEKATAFVADVSIINAGSGRPTPNPNVLIEVGYALKTLGPARMVLVANIANGPVESLPFDLRTKRVLTYHLPFGASDKPEQRRKLQKLLDIALRTVLATLQSTAPSTTPTPADVAIQSINNNAPSQRSLCAKVIPAIADRVKEITPQLRGEERDRWDDELLEAIQKTVPWVTEFASVAEAAAIHGSREAAIGLFRGFTPLFAEYNLKPGFSGDFDDVQFDLAKFVGHELMVCLFAALIGEDRWEIVADLFRETVVVRNAGNRSDNGSVTYIYASEFINLLERRNERLKLNRVSLHADILKERHESGDLAKLCSWPRFQGADFFLYLRSVLSTDQFDLWDAWRPWSAAFLGDCPDYLLQAVRRDKAEVLMKPLGVQTLDEFRNKLKQGLDGLRRLLGSRNPFFFPCRGFNPDTIGTT